MLRSAPGAADIAHEELVRPSLPQPCQDFPRALEVIRRAAFAIDAAERRLVVDVKSDVSRIFGQNRRELLLELLARTPVGMHVEEPREAFLGGVAEESGSRPPRQQERVVLAAILLQVERLLALGGILPDGKAHRGERM